MTSAIDPVVGMQVRAGNDARLYVVTKIVEHDGYVHCQPMTGGGLDLIGFYPEEWKAGVASGVLRPVLWTVGPSLSTPHGKQLRLGRLWCVGGEWIWAAIFCEWRNDLLHKIAAWPTRDAAIAAGVEFGFTAPVARSVVRKVK